MPSNIGLVVFDLGRVLLRLPVDWKHACELAGVRLPPGRGALEPAAQAAVNDIAGRYDTGRLDLESFAREVSPHTGMPPGDIVRLQSCYLLGAYPGVSELLDELSRAGVRTACLSNTSDQHWRMMNDPACPAHLPLEKLDYRFASHLLRMRKPDEMVYAHVERVTETPAERIVFFDDMAENVEGARRRGWHAHRIDPAPDDPLPQVRHHLVRHGVLYTRD